MSSGKHRLLLLLNLLTFQVEGFLEVDLYSHFLSMQALVFLSLVTGSPSSPREQIQLTDLAGGKCLCWTGSQQWDRFQRQREEGAEEDTAAFSSSKAARRISWAGVHLQATDCKIHCINTVLDSQSERDTHETHISHSFIHIFHGFLYTSSMY